MDSSTLIFILLELRVCLSSASVVDGDPPLQ
ncbi:hypothetical protein Godav_012003 [Gossypium davidsonii]|uniref:Uncharacterized protein n=1 Tax=Gossypium davidsonii TaxID=34287 RepID=A0A7J8RC37_GOSDV|nr:hypothetical protein [Gossypium davidsonii]